MRVTRCPRCLAEDIAADAHPARVLDNGVVRRLFVCRNCYRPADLEFRIASETAGVPYDPLPIRETLRSLRDFYLERFSERRDPDLLVDDGEREAMLAPIRAALADIERRLAIAPLEESAGDDTS